MKKLPIVAIQGGLGNQLFQWFFAHGILETSEFSLLAKLPQGKVSQIVYSLGLDPLAKNCPHFRESPERGVTAFVNWLVPFFFDSLWRFSFLKATLHFLGYFREDPRKSAKAHTNPPKRIRYAKGYFQNWEIAQHQGDAIKSELLPVLKEVFLDLQSRFNLEEPYSVIHVRRGDYRTDQNPDTMIGALDDQYFLRWVKEHPSKRIILLTEHSSEVEKLIAALHPTLVLDNSQTSAWETLALMSNADHFLGSNSSLSWWGAWTASLNGAMTYLPASWDCKDRFKTSDFLFPACEEWPSVWENVSVA